MSRTRKAAHRSEAPRVALPRAVAAGVLILGLAIAAHTASGGNLPPLPVLAGLTALTVLGATLASRIRVTFGTVLLLSGLCQQLLHLAFTLLATPLPGSFTTPANGGHHAVPPPQLPATGEDSQGPARQDLHADSAMLMLHAHAAAALLATAVISSWTTTVKRLSALIGHRTAHRSQPPTGYSEP
jgi:hypothetical protein